MSLLIKNGKIYRDGSLIKKNIFIKKGKIIKITGQGLKADKTIDLYLNNIEHIYSNTPEIYRHLVPNYLLLFSEDHAPERIPEVARKGINFLIEKGEFREAYLIAEASRSQFLINYVKKTTGYEHKLFIVREKTKAEE